MINPIKRYFRGGKVEGYNTYFGGIGGLVDTPAKLADIIFYDDPNLGENNISNFEVYNTMDVRCFISDNWAMPGDAFNPSSGANSGNWYSTYGDERVLTFIIDVDGKVTGLGEQFAVFQNSLDFIFFPNLSSTTAPQNIRATLASNVYINGSLTYFGSSASINSTFWGQIIATAPVAYVPVAMQTSNNGGVEADLVFFIDTQGGIVNYINPNEIPIEVQNLIDSLI